jgi:hypothetical protein
MNVMKTTRCGKWLGILCLALLLGLGTVCTAWALCPVGKARNAGKDADKAYEAAMEARGQSNQVTVELTEPGQGVTVAPGGAPGMEAPPEDVTALDSVTVDKNAEMPF